MTDADAAERVARERLARSIELEEVPYASNLALLEQHLRRIRRALRDGERPSSEDLTTAHIALEEIEDDLEDIESIFSWTDLRESEHCRAAGNR